MSKIKTYLKDKYVVFSLIVFFIYVFLRFYQIYERNPFGWDQVDIAWAAKNILVNKEILLSGMQAKGNSGIYIGPLYYYFAAVFYFFTNLDPIASGIISGFSGIISMIVIFFVFRNIFSTKVAFFALVINTFSFNIITFDRIQWPVNFIPVISLLIFYSLYQIAIGNQKQIVFLGLYLGLAFNIHFTSIFYPLIIFLIFPFIRFKKINPKFIFFSLLLFFILVSPILFNLFINSGLSRFTSYGSSYFHGLHLRRIIQISGDIFIQFNYYLNYREIFFVKYILFSLFVFFTLKFSQIKSKILFVYLVAIFFFVPLLVMSTYRGEISDYYYSSTRHLALLVLAVLATAIYNLKNFYSKVFVILILFLYSRDNISDFFRHQVNNPLSVHTKTVIEKINRGERVEFKEGVPESYLYFYYMRKYKNKIVY